MEYIGACKYCGQICSMVTQEFESQEEADDYATAMCNCDRAAAERAIRESILAARGNAAALFGEGCGDLGFDPVSADALAVVNQAIAAVGTFAVKDVSVTLPTGDKGKVSRSKDAIRVTRSRGIVRSLDA